MASNPTPGMLYVTMQRKETLPLAEFHDWYNNEHGQIRLGLPFFVNGLRYQATDLPATGGSPQKPEWLAIYDITDMECLTEPVYTSLQENSSPREDATRVEIDIGRHRFDLISSREEEGFVPLEKTYFPDVDGREGNGRVLVAIGMKVTALENAAEEVGRWYETEHIPLLMKIPGWLRTRRYKTSSISPENAVELVALHEYESINGLGGPEHQAAMNTPWRKIIREKFVACMWRRTYSAYYIFGPAPRDLSSLSRLQPLPKDTKSNKKPTPSWVNPTEDTKTRNGGESESAIESTITTPDGIPIPYRLEGSPDPLAPTLLFSNSLLANWSIWDPFLHTTPLGTHLLKTHRILRYNTRGRTDLPSSSLSPGTKTEPITLQTLTTDILILLTHLRISKLKAIIGVSLGGATVLNFSLKYPERVERFVACDFNVKASGANVEAWEGRIRVATSSPGGMRELARLTVDRWFLPSSSSGYSNTSEEKKGEIKDWIREMVEGNSVSGFVEGVKALYQYDLRGEAEACMVPGLLVVGDGDGVLPRVMEGFRGGIGLGGVRNVPQLRVVAGAGHLPMVERVDGFVDAVGDFLD